MRTLMTVLVLMLTFLAGCSLQQPETPKMIGKPEARQLAADHVNAEFKGHIWQTSIGDRAFQEMSPDDWFLVEIEATTILLKRAGRNGQEFTVSMKPDGSNVKVLTYGFATR